MERSRRPNWLKWKHIPTPRLWQAVALSLDIDPDQVRHGRDSWMVQDHLFDESREFSDRIEIARANLSHPGGLVAKSIALGRPTSATVELRQFANWAIGIGWQLPSDLVALAETGATYQKPTQIVEHPGGDTQALDKPLGTRERTTLLTIVSVLAKKAKIDVTKPSSAATQIEGLTVEAGVRVAARTIEEHLKRIPEALERAEK